MLDDGMDFDVEMWKYARDIKRVSSNPQIGHEHRPGTSGIYMGVPVQINALGLRDREFDVARKPDGPVRTLMLGDSLTFGWGVKAEDTPAKLIETQLNEGQKEPRDEVINTGVGNYNTTMEIAYFLDRGKEMKPDVVVLNYFINDAEPQPKRQTSIWREYSYGYVFLASAIDKLSRQYFGKADWKTYYRDLYRDGAPGWAAAQQAIGQLADYCRENDIKLLVVNYPELHELRDYPFPDVTAGVQTVAKAHGADFLDLLPSVADLEPASLWVSPTDAHPNRVANVRFADAIAKKLTQDFPEVYHRSASQNDQSASYTSTTSSLNAGESH
ncbi:SGNH/GDSL hydrolase family protein [Kaistia granuli]|uniref:SGNH/GDSL hydrolase family protein n=1 Tax=Kaistia granuli TaxID=363259 RepID=UPI0018DCA718|nr:SGNH/GDSL hydrolase family protein [Kaistia granuli]